jgi:enoyl-[acyl-carrier protein] reductase III
MFENKVALVTGSGRGIGAAIARHFAGLGAMWYNYFRNPEPAIETADSIRKLGRRALLVKANMGEPADIERLFETIEQEFGGLDYFIHNAASGYNRPVMQQKLKGWNWTMNINARSLLLAAQKAVPMMEKRGGGAIVAITSPGAARVLPDYVVVGASKAALEAVTRYLAVELSSRNIVVNAVSPGMVLTDALQHFEMVRSDVHLTEKAVSITPAGRLVSPQDIASLVAFVLTSCQHDCGQVITMDGGASLLAPGLENPLVPPYNGSVNPKYFFFFSL